MNWATETILGWFAESIERRTVRAFATGFLLACCAGVLQAQYPAAREIEAVLERQSAAWNRGDIDDYMAGYWKSDSLLFTSGGNIQHGWKVTLEKYKKSYGSKEKMGRLNFSKLEVNLLSPDAAWVFGHWELIRKDDHPHGVFTLIFRKFADGWKIIHDHTSIKAK